MQFHVFLHLKQTIAVSTYCCSFAVMSCFQGIQRVWQGEGRVRGVAWHSKIGCEEHCWINLYTEIGFYLFVLALFCLFIGFFFKERGTSTEPPPRANFSATANQVELEYTSLPLLHEDSLSICYFYSFWYRSFSNKHQSFFPLIVLFFEKEMSALSVISALFGISALDIPLVNKRPSA